jgi:hypothetical protein
MPSLSRKQLLFCFCIGVCAVLFHASSTFACSCAPKRTVLDAYEGSDLVIIADAVSVEKAKDKPGSEEESAGRYGGIVSTRMVVNKVYKGNLKVGDELNFAQGGGADCIWTFSEESIGRKFLFYLDTPDPPSEYVIAITCGRSILAEYAGDDLLYLDNIAKRRGKTRLSGTLSYYQASPVEDEEPVFKRLEGNHVRIIGAKKTYALTTDKNGVYEIYDLPGGKYVVEPEIPRGWKLDRYLSRASYHANAEKEEKDEPSAARNEVRVRAGKHAYFNFSYENANLMRGSVLDPHGEPMNGVCLDLIPARGKAAQYFFKFDCTEDGGKFSIDDIPAGSYYLVFNKEAKISSRQPFPTLFYPGVFEREKAAVITIGEGETVEGLTMHVPAVEETITVEGVLLYSDGKPVPGESVEFKVSEAPKDFDGTARAATDANGKFSIRLLKNLRGELFSEMFVYEGKFENCPKVERMIKDSGETSLEVKTQVVPVVAEQNIFAVELRFPFPGCKMAP